MKRYQLLWILILLLPIRVDAIQLTCPEEVSLKEEFYCTIYDIDVIGIKGEFLFDDVFSYVDMEVSSPWKKYYVSSKGFSVGNISNLDDLNLKVRFRVASVIEKYQDYKISLEGIEASDKDYKLIELDGVSCTLKIVSDINTLDSLEVSNGKLDQKFSQDITSYTATIDSSSTVIKAILTDKNAKLEGSIGSVKLNYGINLFKIKVTSVRGSIREYKLYITRPIKNNDVTLKSLVIGGKEISLKKNQFYYSMDVLNEVHQVEVVATLNNQLSKLEIDNPKELVVGENEIKIHVIAEDGTSSTYLIVVNRKKKLAHDASIKDLSIKGYSLLFDPNIYQYELKIDSEDQLDILVELNDEGASYQIIGNKNLKNNSIIKIEVKAEDGTLLVYQIKIIKESDGNSSSIVSNIKIIPLILFILLISSILVIKIIYKKKK